MAAVIIPQFEETPARAPRRPALRLVPPPATGSAPPVGTTSPVPAPWYARRRSHAVYLRRRIGVLLAALTLAAVAWSALSASADTTTVATGAGPAAVSAPVGASVAPQTTYRVRPGDTLWTIARTLQPEGDLRALVDELAGRNGGRAGLVAGETIDLTGLVP